MALHDPVQGAAEGRHVERSVEAGRERHVVGRSRGLHPVQEPEPLLGVGEGDPCPARDGQQGRRAHQAEGLATDPLDLSRQAGQGGRLEHRRQRQLRPQQAAHTGDEPRRHQRVAAGGEEVVLRPHPLDAQQLRPDPGEQLLDRGTPGRFPRVRCGAARRGQGLAVQLAVGSQGQGRERHEDRGDHELRQPRLQEPPQLGRRHRRARGHDVGDQPEVARPVLAGHHHGLRQCLVGRQGRLHLSQLDPEAAHLHLVVDAAQVVELARRAGSGRGRRSCTSGPRRHREKRRTGQGRTAPPSARGGSGIRGEVPAPPRYSSPGTPRGTGSKCRPRT